MSYIINHSDPFVSIKLTSIGRQKLASGQLNFTHYALGDSELNYDREEVVDANQNTILSGSSRIFRPFDNQPNIKSFVTKQTGEFLNQITPSDINVLKVIVNNQAEERGFFTGTDFSNYQTKSDASIIAYSQFIANTNFAGGTTLNGFSSTSSFNVGDYLLVKLVNDTVTGQTSDDNTVAIPHLWYKIQSLTPTSVTVDRNLPNISDQTGSNSQIYVYRRGEVYDTIATGTTTAYWDSGTLSFDAASNITCHDVPVWNMNNVWCENIAGITGLSTTNIYEDYKKFGSYAFLGTKNPYLEDICELDGDAVRVQTACERTRAATENTINKSMSIIHFTNNSVSNLYGEFLFVDTTNNKTVNVIMPDLMYHRRNFATSSGTTMGMKFISSGDTNKIGVSDIEYINLIEVPTLIPSGATAQVVGRVFPQLKIIVITNDEIVAALSYKSNRNWTLPALSSTLSSPNSGNGVLLPTQTMYLTYSLENDTSSGFTTSLLCQKYAKITNNSASGKNVDFKIEGIDLLPYMRKIELGGYDGLGFNARRFKLVYQVVSNENDRPDPSLWKTYDFTSNAITQVSGATIDPKLLEIQTPATNGFILTDAIDLSATIFDITQSLSLAPNSNPDILQFGDERLYYGNIQSYIGATIYKTVFDIRINSSQFNTTSNPTRSKDSSTNPPNIKVSEVGIYDSDKNLVIIGKLSTPIALLPSATIMLELSLDF